jgi:hypothetical protein
MSEWLFGLSICKYAKKFQWYLDKNGGVDDDDDGWFSNLSWPLLLLFTVD